MKRFCKIKQPKRLPGFVCFCLCAMLPRCARSDNPLPSKPVEPGSHSILVTHPNLKSAEPVSMTLSPLRDEVGVPVEYFMDVQSVSCGDGRCEIVTVRMVWDLLGNFVRYEFPLGGDLTKRGGLRFTMEDHLKLSAILSDRDSYLKNVAPDEMATPSEGEQDVALDGISHATVLTDKSAFVPGAVYTSYTLWHWANCEALATIREISSEAMTEKQLIQYLNSEDQERIVFAIEQLAHRRIHDEEVVKTVAELAEQGRTELADRCLGYFESMGAEVYFPTLEKLFSGSSPDLRIFYISSLTATDLEAPDGFYDRLSGHLSSLETYLEVHMFFSLMAYRNPSSAEFVDNALLLLDHKSDRIARRAYSFLAEQKLTPSQASKLEPFRRRYADRS